MSKIGLQNELQYLLLAKSHLWTGSLASFGGSIGLILFPIPLIVKGIMMSIGFILSVGFLDNYFRKDDRIENIIKNLNKTGD